jgi:hypothetical protein
MRYHWYESREIPQVWAGLHMGEGKLLAAGPSDAGIVGIIPHFNFETFQV